MEFLVRSENRLPTETPEEHRTELRSAERARAMELREAGHPQAPLAGAGSQRDRGALRGPGPGRPARRA